jgi:hypothetical protein
MGTPFFRRLLAALCIPGCLAIARPAGADESSVAVHIESTQENLQVFDRTRDRVIVWYGKYGGVLNASPVYASLCLSTPCDTKLAPRPHQLAVSRSAGSIVEGDEPIWLPGPADIKATYVDRSGWRAAGWATLLAGAVGGSLMVAAAFGPRRTTCDSTGLCTQAHGATNDALLGAGVGTLALGLISGFAMGLRPDAVSFRVTPISVSALSASREGRVAPPDGLALQWVF